MTTHVCNDVGNDTSSIGSGRRSLPRAWKWVRRDRRTLLILCYHGVSKTDEHVWDPRLYIHAETFRRRLQTVRELGYQILPLQEAVDRLNQNSLSGPTAVVTFDDGWHDFHQVAWPILKDLACPATVYQTSYYSHYNRPVFEPLCRYLLWKGKGQVVRAAEWASDGWELDLRTEQATQRAAKGLFQYARQNSLSGEQKDLLLQRLARAVNVSFRAILEARTLHLMNAAEVREVAAGGIDIQLHTHRHRVPTDKRLFFRELDENRAWIEASSGLTPRNFCYPNGEHRPELVAWLREAGVGCATTCHPGVATRRSDAMLLPRFTDANSITQAKFESWLNGFGRIAPSCRRVFRSGSAMFLRQFATLPQPRTSPGKETPTKAVRTWA